MTNRRFLGRVLALMFAGCGFFASAAGAQEAFLSGTITDTTGGVLPGVSITITHEATGNTFAAVSDERGGFRVPVRVGMHRVSAELQGFNSVARSVDLLVGQTAVLNLQLSPSTVQETVTVTGEAPLVDTTDSTLASNIDPRQMQELPVNGRNWMDLTLLAPGSRSNGVAETPSPSQGASVNFQLNLDGQQVTNLVAVDFGQPRFSRDAIGEFEFVSNRFDAKQGRSSGIQVNAITKSGTNTPAGTFAGYFRDDRFNAADPVQNRVLPYSDQQLSATFGGPIRRDRMHFFVSYEYEREPQSYVYTTPYPKFNQTLTGDRRQDTWLGRFDLQFSTSKRLTVRGNRYDNRIPYDPRYTGGSDRTPSSAIGTNRRAEQAFADFTQVIGSSMVNQIKAGHSLFHWNQFAHVNNANSLVGQTAGVGAPVIQLRGLTLGQTHAITPQDIGQELWTIEDEFTTSFNARGRHDVSIGGEYMYDFTFETVCQTCMGQLIANAGPIPANFASLIGDINDVTTWNLAPLSSISTQYIRNVATTSSQWSRPSGNNGFTEYAPRHAMAFYLQDNWAMTNKLTVNAGLRYDAAIGEFVNWVAFPPFIEADRPNDLNNFAPRLGFNYAVTDRTVVRGGYGTYYSNATSQPALFTLRYAQQVAMTVVNDGRPDFASNPFNGPAPTYEQAVGLLCANQPDPGSPSCNLRHSTMNFAAPDLVDPWSHQASFGVQRQIGTTMAIEVDWTFTADRNQLGTRNLNVAFNPATGAPYPIVGAQAAANYRNRPYPGWGTINSYRSDISRNYHALQAAWTKRLSNRWQASATYTRSHSTQFDALPLNPGCEFPMSIQNGQARCDVPITVATDISENEWYVTGDQQNRFTFNGIWEAPYGFQVSGLYIAGDNGFGTASSGVDVRAQGSIGTLAAPQRLRANGTLIERNNMDFAPLHRLDMRVQRRFAFGSKVRVDGILEIYNVLNRKNFDPTLYTFNELNPRYGQPNSSTALAYAPRMLQLGFRAAF